MLPQKWEKLVENADQLQQAPAIKRLGLLRLLLPLGLLALVVGGYLFYDGSSARHREQNSIRSSEMAKALKTTIAEAEAGDQATVDQLKRAFAKVEAADPADDNGLDEAIELAKAAGLTGVPLLKRLDATQENIGIAEALARYLTNC